jgi:hypothetical protein
MTFITVLVSNVFQFTGKKNVTWFTSPQRWLKISSATPKIFHMTETYICKDYMIDWLLISHTWEDITNCSINVTHTNQTFVPNHWFRWLVNMSCKRRIWWLLRYITLLRNSVCLDTCVKFKIKTFIQIKVIRVVALWNLLYRYNYFRVTCYHIHMSIRVKVASSSDMATWNHNIKETQKSTSWKPPNLITNKN